MAQKSFLHLIEYSNEFEKYLFGSPKEVIELKFQNLGGSNWITFPHSSGSQWYSTSICIHIPPAHTLKERRLNHVISPIWMRHFGSSYDDISLAHEMTYNWLKRLPVWWQPIGWIRSEHFLRILGDPGESWLFLGDWVWARLDDSNQWKFCLFGGFILIGGGSFDHFGFSI